MSRKKKIVIIVLSLISFVILSISGLYLFLQHRYNKDILADTPTNDSEQYVEPDKPEEKEQNYEVEADIVNVLLVGVDTRGEFNDSRTDSIIIATIDPTVKKVKLTSLMRDMYVEIPKKGYQKINAAFELGGIDLLRKTIQYNFGMNVNYYAAIDFRGFQELIDKMDGVELEVKNYEVNEINKYIDEVNGSDSTLLNGTGMQKLNGQQALSYCRIRKVGNNDYERTERQRRVLSLLLNKVKDTKITNYPGLYSTITPYLKTNIPFNTMLKLGYTVYKFDNFTPDSLRLPIDNHFKDTYVNMMSVLIPELRYNATELYKFIYNTVPEKLTVPDNSKVYNQKPVSNGKGEEDNEPEEVQQTPTPQPTSKPDIQPSTQPTQTPKPTPASTPTPKATPQPTASPKPASSATPSPSPVGEQKGK